MEKVSSSSVAIYGAGGNAKSVYDAVLSRGYLCCGFIDSFVMEFFGLPRIPEDRLWIDSSVPLVMGVGGVTPDQLSRRYDLAKKFGEKRWVSVVARSAVVSELSSVGAGATVFQSAVIDAAARIGDFSLINIGSAVCHDACIGKGSHVCPGAKVLGGAIVGDFCVIGANAVVLPRTVVPSGTTVPACSRF
ncbi:hypothetical protein [Candidatus Hydrogenosomobacter endosymbioticus]|uniref:PglD N-terminal domain-containing protein n=1 Tax=Candidatus Hydrogenosomobacter endosymbioticus TaxID=2558174 RepID=A0ABN6L2W1_9PROT|nr:hypothetical protein [Candidatus Hydrogenosomobacter endosymbioticus]BDB96191.1 hypothetical protein HYD_3240 [Candidatus Hydrogenosomobacter endosymbioticus]